MSKTNVILDELVDDIGWVWRTEGMDWRFHAVKTMRGMCGSCSVEITVVTVYHEVCLINTDNLEINCVFE